MPPLIQFSSDSRTRTPDKHLIEDSIALRSITTLMALLGILIAAGLTESPPWLVIFAVLGCIFGSCFSYYMRYRNNLIGKIWISVGILIVAALFFNELLVRVYANVADARTPLTQMLMALMALHSFDLPRRRDLSLSALVGFILITSASTLSRDFSFLLYFSVFFVLAAVMFQLDCQSRTCSRAFINLRPRKTDTGPESAESSAAPAAGPEATSFNAAASKAKSAGAQGLRKLYSVLFPRHAPVTLKGIEKQTFGSSKFSISKNTSALGSLALLMLLCTLFCFAVLPRFQISLLKQIRIGTGSNLPFLGQISSPTVSLAQLFSPDGSIKSQPNSYYGFAESLDTNYRGKLGDRVVLRIQGGAGNYLRGMAYDTFDGTAWTMSLPKKTVDCYASINHAFEIPLKNSVFPNVRYKDILQVIYVEEDSSNLVVYTSYPYQVYFPAQKLQVDTYGAIRSPVGIQKDMVYTVFSNVPIYDYEKLRQQPPPQGKRHERWQRRLEAYLAIPKLDPKVAALARSTAGSGGNFQKAERMCRYLLSQYKYDLDIGQAAKGRDTVSDFLFDKKRGYCEHFASALAIMCRTQGIPSRLVTGYAPGQYNPFTGLWDVRLCDAHSWTEVFIEGAGWVPLDATPSGMGIGYQGQEQPSVFAFLEGQLLDNWKKFSQSNEGKKFAKAADAAINSLGFIAAALSTNLQTLLLISAGLAALMSAALLNRNGVLFRSLMSKWRQQPLSEELKLHAAATDEYLKVLALLESFEVSKRPGDTASDIIQKLYFCKRSAELEQSGILMLCRDFFDIYARVRFGASGELSELKSQSMQLHDLAEKLTSQRSSASIS